MSECNAISTELKSVEQEFAFWHESRYTYRITSYLYEMFFLQDIKNVLKAPGFAIGSGKALCLLLQPSPMKTEKEELHL